MICCGETRFAEAKRVPPDRVLRIELSPLVIVVRQCLSGIVGSRNAIAVGEASRDAGRVRSAEIRGLQNRTQHGTGRVRVCPDVIRKTGQHAAEILRPWPVDGGVDEHMTDASGAQLLRLGREAEERVDFAADKQLDRFELGVGDPADVLLRVEPDLGDHQGHENMRVRTRRLDSDGLSLQIGDAADAVPGEQLEAAGHHASQYRYPLAGIDRRHALRGIERPKVDLAARDRRVVPEIRPLDIADIGKALGAQQFLGDLQGGNAQGRLQQANRRGFERPRPGERSRHAEQAGRTGQ